MPDPAVTEEGARDACDLRVWRFAAIGITPWVEARESRLRLGAYNWSRILHHAFLAILLVNIFASVVWIFVTLGGLKDLDSFLHSAEAYARGLDPYNFYPWFDHPPISSQALNLNPPISVYLFQPLINVDREALGIVFLIGSLAMVGASVALLMRAYPDKQYWLFALIVVALAGTWQMLYYLQLYAPLVLAMTGAWLLLRRGDMLLAGVLIGLIIAIKPNYGLVALALLVAGHYRPGVAACAVAAAISAIPLLIDGPGIYLQWLQLTSHFDGYAWTSNASLVSISERLGYALPGQIATGLFALAALIFLRRVRPAPLDAAAVGILTVLVVGPVSWAGYTLLLLPYLFSIQWDRWTWVAVGMLVMPFAPIRIIEMFGLSTGGVSDAVDSSAGFFATLIPDPLITLVSAVVLPLIAAIYAWAVLLLFARLALRLWRERGDAQPVAQASRPPRRPRTVVVRRPRPLILGHGLPRPGELSPYTAATVHLRYDA